jgi:hypothetical protein
MSESMNIGNGKLYCDGEYIGEVGDAGVGTDKKVEVSKGGITISVELEGYDRVKQQLRNLEATMDRLIEKQKQIEACRIRQDYDKELRARGFRNGKSHMYEKEIIEELDSMGATKKDNMIEVVAKLYNIPLNVIQAVDVAGEYEALVCGFRTALKDGTILNKFKGNA